MANRPPPVTPAFSKAASGKSAPSRPKEHLPAKKREAPTFEHHPPGMGSRTRPPPELQDRKSLQEIDKKRQNILKDTFNEKAR